MTFTLGTSTVTTPYNCNGTPGQVTTTQNAGESLEDFWERHLDDVRAAEEACT